VDNDVEDLLDLGLELIGGRGCAHNGIKKGVSRIAGPRPLSKRRVISKSHRTKKHLPGRETGRQGESGTGLHPVHPQAHRRQTRATFEEKIP
jgi:hypothetical protein